jgi:hypothetical protein
MIPIPDYIKNIAHFEQNDTGWSMFNLVCPCGEHRFNIIENKLTKEEKKQLELYYKALDYLITGKGGGLFSFSTVDEDGIVHHWKSFDKDRKKVEEVIIPEVKVPSISVLKARCVNCNKEHIIFDSRFYGYDGMTSDKNNELINYKPMFKQKGKKEWSLQIKIENDESLELFNENTGLNFDEKQYSNAFSWIIIYGTDSKGKKMKLFEVETA